MRDLFVKKLYLNMIKDPSVILLTADLGFGAFECFEPYRNKQYFNLGISEQLMASMAAGLSIEGFKVYMYSIGVFPSFRCLEQIRNDISYHDCDVTIVTTGAGFSYGSLGMTHHCVQDIGVMMSIPNINILSPANNFEMEDILEKSSGLRYLRIDKSQLKLEPISSLKNNFIYCYFNNSYLPSHEKTLLLSHGSIGSIAIPFLENKYNLDFYSVACLNESEELLELCRRYKRIITIEEHSVVNGFFTFIVSLLAKNKVSAEIEYLSLPNEHFSIVGDQNYLRNELNLNSKFLLRKLI